MIHPASDSQILHFNDIHEYKVAIHLKAESNFSDFFIYDYEKANLDACNQLSTFRQNYFEISLEISDNCTSIVDQFELPDAPNRLLLISPHRLQTVRSHASADHPHKGYGIFFNPEFIHSHPENSLFLKHYPFFRHLNSPFISLDENEAKFYSDLIEKILTEYKNADLYSRDIIKNYLNILLMKARQNYPEMDLSLQLSNPGRDREIYDEFSELVQNHALQKKSVREYAEKMHITPKHLSETVKKVSGQNALDVIHATQINHAKALLRQTTRSVTEIAYDLNFENPEYFSVFFKRLTGVSPSEFRSL